jgi:hypothetical protein
MHPPKKNTADDQLRAALAAATREVPSTPPAQAEYPLAD